MKKNEPGNVLMVSNYPSDTGYAWWLMQHFWKLLSEICEKKGSDAFLAYPKITTLPESVSDSSIKPIELTVPWKSNRDFINVCKFIKEHNIRYLYLTDQPYFNFQFVVMRLLGVKRIIIHDHTPGDRPPVKGLKGLVKAARNALPWFTADKILCVSELMRQRNISNGRIPPYKCSVVQNGIHLVECDSHQNKKLREKLGVKSDTLLVMTSGRAHPYKRFDFIIESAKVVKDKMPGMDIVFLLVGDGPAMPELENLVKNYNLNESVRLLGFRDDVRDLLCTSDLAFHAALGEGFSLSIIEYMSAGLPVLVPDIPSVSQATEHNKTGIIYPTNNVEVVANEILKLANDNKLRESMGIASQKEANTKYTIDLCTENFIHSIENVIT